MSNHTVLSPTVSCLLSLAWVQLSEILKAVKYISASTNILSQGRVIYTLKRNLSKMLCPKATIAKLLASVFVFLQVTGAYPPSFDLPLDPQILLKDDFEVGPHGAVASESKYCSERGIRMLGKQNKQTLKYGTAADVVCYDLDFLGSLVFEP
jgi:hypothetical protein